MPRLAFALTSSLLLAGCTTAVQLPYAASRPVVPASAATSSRVLPVVDQRNEEPNWVGAIRGGFGNPLKVLRTDRPLSELVQQAFSDALAARGLEAAPGAQRYDIRVTMHKLDADRVARLEATADFQVDVIDRATGGVVYTDRVRVNQVQGSVLALDTGVFASTEGLRTLAVQVQNQAIDQLLDKPGFRAAVQPRGALRS